MSPSKPNILFLVWDAFRVDAVSHAPTFQKLRENNLYYSTAVAPCSWSLPSHVSLLDGTYPHEHGVVRADDDPERLYLPEELARQGYQRYCVSANAFVSPSHRFDDFFDEYYFTIARKFSRGQSVSDYYDEFQALMTSIEEWDVHEATSAAFDIISDIFQKPKRRYSLANLLGGVIQTATSTSGDERFFNRIPHPMFNSANNFGFNPSLNTEIIQKTIRKHAESNEPFFIFSNYFNTHWPFVPPAKYQREYLGEELSYRELDRLNKKVANPWRFHSWEQSAEDESELEIIRKLYRAEVAAVDAELRKIIRTLENQGLREETIIVITSDHGEMLGERGPLGWRAMGHAGSVSDHLLTVPLLVSHPDCPASEFESPVSLTTLAAAIADNQLSNLTGKNPLKTRIAGCEIPPRGTDHLYESFPNAPTERIEEDIDSFTVVGYMDEWKLMHSSLGTEKAWQNGSEADLGEAPEGLSDWVGQRLSTISDDDQKHISEEARKHLKQMGYI